jgi:hypothetical protein
MNTGISFEEFLAFYNYFPHAHALDGHGATPDQLAVLQRSRKRIRFHFQVASVLSGLYLKADSEKSSSEDAGRFAPAVGLMRLRTLVSRYPDFKAEPQVFS